MPSAGQVRTGGIQFGVGRLRRLEIWVCGSTGLQSVEKNDTLVHDDK